MMKFLIAFLHVGFIFTATLVADKLHVENLHAKSLTLSQPTQTPLKDSNLTLHVKDNKGKEIQKDITWIVKPPYTIRQNGTNVIIPLKDTDIKIKAKYKGVLSNEINLHVKWIVNGHTLPPMPDEKINNSTLLGIDINNNGVRDDVERWIYKEFDEYIPCKLIPKTIISPNGKKYEGYNEVCEKKPKKYHQIVREIGMQATRAAQIIIQEPKKALETTKLMDAADDCLHYFLFYAKDYDESIGIEKNNIKYYENSPDGKKLEIIQFNTIDRARAYGQYNFNLSGHVFTMEKNITKMRNSCDFNITKLLKDNK